MSESSKGTYALVLHLERKEEITRGIHHQVSDGPGATHFLLR